MAKRVIYFDLDGTLWSDNREKFSSIGPAWDRLPFAVEKANLQMPKGHEWKEHAGGTDLGVVYAILIENKVDASSMRAKAREVISYMEEYYQIHHLDNGDLRSAVFPDVLSFFEKIKQREAFEKTREQEGGVPANEYVFGVVTGNSRAVTRLKLEDSGLSQFFPDEKLWFCGDEAENRWELLKKANQKQNELYPRDERDRLFIYVADTNRDYLETYRSYQDIANYIPEFRLLLRLNNLLAYTEISDSTWYLRPKFDCVFFHDLDDSLILNTLFEKPRLLNETREQLEARYRPFKYVER